MQKYGIRIEEDDYLRADKIMIYLRFYEKIFKNTSDELKYTIDDTDTVQGEYPNVVTYEKRVCLATSQYFIFHKIVKEVDFREFLKILK